MPPVYKLRKYHTEIFGTAAPASFFEMLFKVEAPKFFTDIDIWQYVERMPNNFREFPLQKEEANVYPFYEIYLHLMENGIKRPLIFQYTDGNLECIEGRHRLRLMALMRRFKMFPEIPCVVCEIVGEIPEDRIPEKYWLWQEWMHDEAIVKVARERKKQYEELLYKE
jgi:hypothetical protein